MINRVCLHGDLSVSLGMLLRHKKTYCARSKRIDHEVNAMWKLWSIDAMINRSVCLHGDLSESLGVSLRHRKLFCTQWTRGENSYHVMGTRRGSSQKPRIERLGEGGGVRSRGFEQTCRNIPTTFHTIFHYSGQMGFGEDFLKLWRFLHIYFYVKTILKLNPPLWSYNSLGDNDLYKVESTIFILYIFILSTHIIRTHSK